MKGLGKNTRATHQQLVNKAGLRGCKDKQSHLHIALIDPVRTQKSRPYSIRLRASTVKTVGNKQEHPHQTAT